MAETFQPQLNAPSHTRYPSGYYEPADYSIVSKVLGNVIDNRDAALKAQKKLNEDQAVSGAYGQLLELQNEVDTLKGREQDTLRGIDSLMVDGISESERPAFEKYQQDLKLIKDARSQGVLNENQYRIRARKILIEANSLAPGIAPALQAMEGSKLKMPEATTEEAKLYSNVITQVEAEFGPGNATPENIKYMIDRNRTLANYDERLKAGNMTAANLIATVGPMYQTFSNDVANWALNVYNQKGVLEDSDIAEYQSRMMVARQSAQQYLRKTITEGQAKGQVFDVALVNQMMSALDSEHQFLTGITDGKDLGSRLKYLNEVQQLTFATQNPWLSAAMTDAAKSGTGYNMLQVMIGMMKDPEFKQAFTALGNEWANGINFSPEELIAKTFNMMVNGWEPKDPIIKKLQATVADQYLKQGITDPKINLSGAKNSFIEEALKDQEGKVATGNIPSAIKSYVDKPDSYKRAFVANLSDTERTRTRNLMMSMSTATMAELERVFVESDGQISVAGSTAEGAFRPVASTKESGRNKGDSVIRAKKLSNALNDLLRLARDPNYVGIAPTEEDIFNSVTRALAKAKEGLPVEEPSTFEASGRNK